MRRSMALILPGAMLSIWWLASQLSLVDPLFLPSPLEVLKSLVDGITNDHLAKDALATVFRSITGFLISAVIGIPIGLVIGRIPSLSQAMQPTVDFFRSIPATALFPLFLVLFGLGDAAKVAIVVYACALIILVNTAYGAQQVKAARILSASVMGASRREIFLKIVIPESAPGVFAGLRVALSLSFVLIIVTEMFIGTTVGLGYRIMNAQMVYRIPEMYAGIILAGALGYFGNRLVLVMEARVLHWVGK